MRALRADVLRVSSKLPPWAYPALLVLSWLWAIGNAVYVYAALDGARSFRVESAVFLFVALLLPLAASRRAAVPGTKPTTELSARQCTALSVAVGVAWLAALLSLLRLPFLSDDYVFLAEHQTLPDAFHASHFFRPAFGVLFLALSRLGGGSPIPFHIAGLLLHLSSALLARSLARRMFASPTAALIVFVAFLLNPLQLEATLWPSGLQELLWVFFLLAALHCYTGSSPLTWRRLLVTLAFLIGALLSKETAVCFVLVVPAADLVAFQGRERRLRPWLYVACLALLAGYLAVRSYLTAYTDALHLVRLTRHFAKNFLSMPYRYFAQPWSRAMEELPAALPVLCCALVLTLLLLAVLRGATRRALYGPVLVLLTTLPLWGYFYVGPDLMAARYLYLPALGWGLLVAEMLTSLRMPRGLLLAAVALVACGSFAALLFNLRPWREAGELVVAVGTAVEQGDSPEAAARQWAQRNKATLVLQGPCPRDHRGVALFINGCSEFLHLHRPVTGR